MHCEDKLLGFVVPGGWRAQVPPRVLCVSELQGGDRGQGYLCLGGAFETLLVSLLHMNKKCLFIYMILLFFDNQIEE